MNASQEQCRIEFQHNCCAISRVLARLRCLDGSKDKGILGESNSFMTSPTRITDNSGPGVVMPVAKHMGPGDDFVTQFAQNAIPALLLRLEKNLMERMVSVEEWGAAASRDSLTAGRLRRNEAAAKTVIWLRTKMIKLVQFAEEWDRLVVGSLSAVDKSVVGTYRPGHGPKRKVWDNVRAACDICERLDLLVAELKLAYHH